MVMKDQNTPRGHLHPITQTIREIYSIFAELGFEIALGPELEYAGYILVERKKSRKK
jgi:phenylalanyl-tRNA synthetase alpha subunit